MPDLSPNASQMGDAVHNVLVHLAQHPLGFDEPFENRLTRLEATTEHWLTFPVAYQQRIRIHWHAIASLYTESNGVWFEKSGPTGLRPDMTRRLREEWQVLEFKTGDTNSMRQKSRLQIRDVMARLVATLPQGTRVTGYRVYLPLALDEPATPVWTKVTFTPSRKPRHHT